jgi:hypothetical protein
MMHGQTQIKAGGVHFLECSFQAFAENQRIRVPASHDQLLPLPDCLLQIEQGARFVSIDM